MTRPYRDALPVEHALDIMEKDTGTSIDAGCLEALRAVITGFEID